MTGQPHRLNIRANPLRMFFSASPWTATAYLLSYLPVGTVLFAFALVVLVIAYALNITWLGLPLLIGAAGIVRGCAEIERGRTLLVAPRVEGAYRPVRSGGIFAQVKTRWTDPATLRDCSYLLLMYPLLLVMDTATLIVWGTVLGLITVPLWFWAIPQTWPNGDTAHGLMLGKRVGGIDGSGGLWVGDLPTALLVAAGGFVLALAAAYLVVGVAGVHLKIARTLLGQREDPLAAARRVLAAPGPLPTLHP